MKIQLRWIWSKRRRRKTIDCCDSQEKRKKKKKNRKPNYSINWYTFGVCSTLLCVCVFAVCCNGKTQWVCLRVYYKIWSQLMRKQNAMRERIAKGMAHRRKRKSLAFTRAIRSRILFCFRHHRHCHRRCRSSFCKFCVFKFCTSVLRSIRASYSMVAHAFNKAMYSTNFSPIRNGLGIVDDDTALLWHCFIAVLSSRGSVAATATAADFSWNVPPPVLFRKNKKIRMQREKLETKEQESKRTRHDAAYSKRYASKLNEIFKNERKYILVVVGALTLQSASE